MMQFIELPNDIAGRLSSVVNKQEFIIEAITEKLEINKNIEFDKETIKIEIKKEMKSDIMYEIMQELNKNRAMASISESQVPISQAEVKIQLQEPKPAPINAKSNDMEQSAEAISEDTLDILKDISKDW